jgi:hypothetical protein
MMVLRVVKGVTSHFITRWSEWVKASVALAMGIQLLQPVSLFSAYPVYRVMEAMADENTWGWLLVGIGSLRLLALGINGTFHAYGLHTLTPLVRAALSFLSAGVWFAFALGYWVALSGGVGFIMAGGLMLCDIGLCLNIAREAGAADQRSRSNGIRG